MQSHQQLGRELTLTLVQLVQHLHLLTVLALVRRLGLAVRVWATRALTQEVSALRVVP